MGIKALLMGISLFEVGMLYWLLCGTVLEKEYFKKKDWVILCASIVGAGIDVGGNRSLIFFSQYAFIICIAVTCICVLLISGQYKFLRIIIVILYYPESRAIDTKNFPLVWLNCCSRNGSRGYPSYALE